MASDSATEASDPLEEQKRAFPPADALPGLVFVADAHGGNTHVDEQFERFVGLSAAALARAGWDQILHPEDRERSIEGWNEAVRAGALYEATYRLRRHDGVYRWHLCRAAPMRDESGAITQWAGICFDIEDQKRAEEQQALLASIVAASDDAIVSKTLEGIIQSWNAGAEGLFGYSAAEAIGQPITLIIPPERIQEEHDIIARLRRGERIDHFETVRVAKSGRLIEVSLTISPVFDRQGCVIGASKIARDITERKRAEEAVRRTEERTAAIVELLPIGIGIIDSSGRTLSLNPAGLAIHGHVSLDDMLVHFDRYRERFELRYSDGRIMPFEEWPAARALRGDYVSDHEVRLRRPDGEERLVSVSAVPLPANGEGAPLIVFVMLDVTERKRVEEELAESRNELRLVTDHAATMLARCDDESRYLFVNRSYTTRFGLDPETIVGERIADVIGAEAYGRIAPYVERVLQGERVEFEIELAYDALGPRFVHCIYVPELEADKDGVRSFVAAITDISERRRLEEQLRDADRRKDEFLAMLGHELRNPLAALNSGLELVQRTRPEQAGKVAGMMRRQLTHLVRLVDDLVDVSRISRGKLELRQEVLDVNDVVQAGAGLVKPMIEQRQHRFTVELAPSPILVDGDSDRLTQVIGNLLSNAAKYTATGGAIGVRTEARDGEAFVRVTDNGLGIPPDRLESLFELFQQLPEHRGQLAGGGLGIGLALARQIAELHHGTVEAYSAGLGQGSQFTVRLPLSARVNEGPNAETAEPVAGLPRLRILVVDDNDDAAEALHMLLEMMGHEVRTASDGPAALDMLGTFRPQVMLLDIGLPRMDGYEVARRVRTLPVGDDVLLLALTGWGQEDDKQRAHAAGFDEHLTKPIDSSKLLALLARRFVAGA